MLVKIIGWIFACIIILIFMFGYPIWQYKICREQVCKGDGCFWYCIQHAG